MYCWLTQFRIAGAEEADRIEFIGGISYHGENVKGILGVYRVVGQLDTVALGGGQDDLALFTQSTSAASYPRFSVLISLFYASMSCGFVRNERNNDRIMQAKILIRIS